MAGRPQRIRNRRGDGFRIAAGALLPIVAAVMGVVLVSGLPPGYRSVGEIAWWACCGAGLLTIGALAYLVRNPDGSIFTSDPDIARANAAVIRRRSRTALAVAPVIAAVALATLSGWGWIAIAGAACGFGSGFVALAAVGWWRLREAERRAADAPPT